MSDTQEKLTARERARKAQAVALEAQRKRESDNLADLEKYFKASDDLERARTKYDADLKKLNEAFEPKQQRYEGAAAEALARMKERGESATAISAQTGLSVAEVTALTKKAVDADSDGAADDDGRSTVSTRSGVESNVDAPAPEPNATKGGQDIVAEIGAAP